MSIHPKTVLGFLEKWGSTAPAEDVAEAAGVLLGWLAQRGIRSALEVAGQSFEFSPEQQDRARQALRETLNPQMKIITA